MTNFDAAQLVFHCERLQSKPNGEKIQPTAEAKTSTSPADSCCCQSSDSSSPHASHDFADQTTIDSDCSSFTSCQRLATFQSYAYVSIWENGLGLQGRLRSIHRITPSTKSVPSMPTELDPVRTILGLWISIVYKSSSRRHEARIRASGHDAVLENISWIYRRSRIDYHRPCESDRLRSRRRR